MRSLRYFTLLFVLNLFFFSNSLFAQFLSKNNWKKKRQEIIFGFGVGNFLGDLGGRDAIGTDYSPIDLELALTRPAAMGGYRYRLSPNWAVRGELNYLRLWGDDKLTKEPFRNNRNLYFRSNVFELSANIEYVFSREKGGNRYHLKHTFKTRQKASSFYSYIFTGISGFYFNPKTKFQGSWVALQPLSTEGQGLIPGKKKYSRISVSIPMGVGVKMNINDQWCVGLEANYRLTFTDYIDDCSTVYYDNHALNLAKGPIAAALADPNQGNFPIQIDPTTGKTRDGLQRGDSRQNDAYMNLSITGGYYLKTKKRKKTRSKF